MMGMNSARRSVPLSRKICKNSLRKTARNDDHISASTRNGGFFGQRDEDVFERGPRGAHGRVAKARDAHGVAQSLIIELAADHGVHGLAEDRRFAAVGLLAQPHERL